MNSLLENVINLLKMTEQRRIITQVLSNLKTIQMLNQFKKRKES